MSRRHGVSIVIANRDGRAVLGPCLESVDAARFPSDRREVIVVDNGSGDGSADFVRERFPWARLLALGKNAGYAPAINAGAAAASNEILVFLDNDTRAEPGFLEPLVDAIASGEAAAAGAKLLAPDGLTIDFAGGGTNFHGIAFQRGAGLPDGEEHSRRGPTLFPCGAAMAVDRAVFRDAGGHDEDFFAYYEDVDLGWRLWNLGYRVLYVPESRVRHHRSTTSKRLLLHRLRVLHFRNPMWVIAKNYDDASFARVWPAALMLNLRRSLYLAPIDPEEFRLGGSDRDFSPDHAAESAPPLSLPRLAASDWVAYRDLTTTFPRLLEKRRALASLRRRPDSEVLPLFVDPFWAVEEGDEYLAYQREVERFFGIDALFPGFEKRTKGPCR